MDKQDSGASAGEKELACLKRRAGQLTRLLRTQGEIGRMLARENERVRVFTETCAILVGHGGYAMAWIGLADFGTGDVRPVAQAGAEDDYLARIEVRCDDTPLGRGPTGTAIRTGLPAVNRDTETNSAFAPWREQAHHAGYRSSAAFPLRVGGEVIGAVNVYASQPDAFDASEVEVLVILVDSVGTALQAIEERDAHMEAHEQMRKLSHALEQTADLVMITDRDGVVEYVNPAFERITGWSLIEVLGRTPRVLKSGRQGPEFYQRLWRAVLDGEVFRDLFINRRKSGELYFEEKTITPLRNAVGRITHFIATGKDITERMQTEERLHHLAYHDVLTDLPNRALFIERLNHAITRARVTPCAIAVLVMNMDRFNVINDTLGHDMGDRVLQGVAQRLRACAREGDTLARLAGDEFALLAEDAELAATEALARRIADALAAPVLLDEREIFVAVSTGISLFPSDGEEAAVLLRNADLAMHRAKNQGSNIHRFYAPELGAQSLARLDLETRLRRALERDEFCLHYQPQIEVASGRVAGLEALLRWQHPERGLVSPQEFIPLLEETGLIVPVGEWVLWAVCAQARAWRRAGLTPPRIAVNVSGRQFEEPDFAGMMERVLRRGAADARDLEFEITESMLAGDMQAVLKILGRLRELGAGISIDDFGTGYSSLSYLKRLPIDTLKIDRSFVRDSPSDADGAAIVQTIIAMSKKLELRVIAEGVETEEQWEFLRAGECDMMQGFLISPPLPAEEMADFLRAHPVRGGPLARP